MKRSGVVTLLTDFGPASVYVGQMHGVLVTLAPSLRVIDMAHDCPAGEVASAGYVLQRSYGHFPAGSVHVAVVDPGVGSARAALAVRAHGHLFVAPDNGLLGNVLATADDPEIRRVENRALMSAHVSPTFHGRDVFAPVAAHLARGTPLAEVGPVAEAEIARPGPEIENGTIRGRVLIADRFGNLITDIPRAALESLDGARGLRVRAGDAFIEGLARTFSDVPRGEALVYVGSGDHLEIAVNGGRASDLLGLSVGAFVHVEPRR